MPTEEASPLCRSLAAFAPTERQAWVAEVERLAHLVEAYAAVHPKRTCHPATGKYLFTREVLALCEQARCTDPLIIRREPHRARPPSPHTLERWLQSYRRDGPAVFLRTPLPPTLGSDRRRAPVSAEAVNWINVNWRRFRSPRHLYRVLEKEAQDCGWTIPSESWLYRQWRRMPEVVRVYSLEGKSAYESRYALYVPRDVSEIAALQVLCGDHSERDVTVLLPDGGLARPWLTVWQDLRTSLIWGWHLDLVPSSVTAGLAYADGVQNFGSQPVSRSEDGFFSYIYTDRGRDYRSHTWDGRVIAVHEAAMRLDGGGLELLRRERRVGLLDDLAVRHLLARPRNAREKPVERVFKDITAWEENTFEEFCGRNAKSRPERWRQLYAQHQQFERGMRPSSPFLGFDEYRTELAGFLTRYNASPHERTTLGGAHLVPLEEYRRLYTTRYEISPENLALLLMKAEKRVIRKNGVNLFRPDWYYHHDELARFKGAEVEVRYSEGDYSRVWVVLPDGRLCEAMLIRPVSPLTRTSRRCSWSPRRAPASGGSFGSTS